MRALNRSEGSWLEELQERPDNHREMTVSLAQQGTRRRPLTRRLPVTIAILSLAGLLTLASCSDGEQGKDAKASSSPPSQSADPDAGSRANVLETYRGYWDAQVRAYAKANSEGTGLERFAADKALAEANGELVDLGTKGLVYTGKPSISPKVTALDTKKAPKRATITDCVDVKNWRPVRKKTGKPVPLPSERLTRFVTTVSLRTVGKEWMVVEATPQDRTC